MKLLDIVKGLANQGYIITYRVRKDGGILITTVNGERFTGARGNAFVRDLVGIKLSEARVKQLESIKPKKNTTPQMRKKAVIEDDIKKQIQRVNRRLKRKGLTAGHVTITQFRKNIQMFGEKEARRLLGQAEKYTRGEAYVENIKWYKDRLDSLINWLGGDSDLEEISELIQNIIDNDGAGLQDSTLNNMYDALYDLEKTVVAGEHTAQKNYNRRMKALLPNI